MFGVTGPDFSAVPSGVNISGNLGAPGTLNPSTSAPPMGPGVPGTIQGGPGTVNETPAPPSKPSPYASGAYGAAGLVNNPWDATSQALANQIVSDQQNATNLQGQATQFQQNMPGYVGSQVGTATDMAKYNLANDIVGQKQSANARGLLNSGIEQAGEGNVAAEESSKLAGQIQNINTSASSLQDQYNQQALTAQQQENQEAANYNKSYTDYQQNLYDQALQQQQANNQFIGSMVSGGVNAALGIAGLLADIF